MIGIHPLDGYALSGYLSEHGLSEGAAVPAASEGGEFSGTVSLTIEGEGQAACAVLHTFEYGDDFTGELLLRAAISYAFNRAVPPVKAPISLENEIFKKIGFKTDKQSTSIKTLNVVHFCKKQGI